MNYDFFSLCAYMKRSGKGIKICLCFIIIMFMLMTGLGMSIKSAHAQYDGNSFPAPCASDGLNMHVNGSSCTTTATGDSSGVFGIGAGQKIGPISGGVFIGYWQSYPPMTGKYRMRVYLCESNWGTKCLISHSSRYLDSVNMVSLSSSTTLWDTSVDFGGFPTETLSNRSMLCLTLVDEFGKTWSSSDPTSCEDASELPETPATCYLNYGDVLDIDFGMLERRNISTVPASGTSGNVKKTFPVLCTRDAGVTVKTTLQFTPLTVNGNEVVSTSTSNLGVAIFYNGKLVGPTSTPVTETFETGYTDRELEFQAIRNPDVALKDIPSGTFTASAVMVMTEQ